MALIQLFTTLFDIFLWANKFAPFFMQLLFLAVLAVVVYLFEYSPKSRNTKRSSTKRDNTGCKEPASVEFIFTSIKTTGLRKNNKFVYKDTQKVEDIVVDVIFYLSVLANTYFVVICYALMSHSRMYPGGTGYGILAVYYFGFIIWCITIWQVIIGFILFFQNNHKRFLIRLPGLIILIIGFWIFNYNLMLVFSD